jgi:hypothetical protein
MRKGRIAEKGPSPLAEEEGAWRVHWWRGKVAKDRHAPKMIRRKGRESLRHRKNRGEKNPLQEEVALPRGTRAPWKQKSNSHNKACNYERDQ